MGDTMRTNTMLVLVFVSSFCFIGGAKHYMIELEEPGENNVELEEPGENNVELEEPVENNVELKEPGENNVELEEPKENNGSVETAVDSGPTIETSENRQNYVWPSGSCRCGPGPTVISSTCRNSRPECKPGLSIAFPKCKCCNYRGEVKVCPE